MTKSGRAHCRALWTAAVILMMPVVGTCSVDSSGLSEPGNLPVTGSGGSGGTPVSGSGGSQVTGPGTGGRFVTPPGSGGIFGSGGSLGSGGTSTRSGGSTGTGGTNAGSGGAAAGTGGIPVVGDAGGASGTGGTVGGTGGTVGGTGETVGGTGGSTAGGRGGFGAGGRAGFGAGGRGGTVVVPPPPPPSINGCADGTREAFVSVNRFPTVAGCAGGWSVPGVLSVASLMPTCDLGAGNSGPNPNGAGCSVADLCGVGWHVCQGALELTGLGVSCESSGIPNGANAAPQFYVTRQHGGQGTSCSSTDVVGVNNLHGCGNFGLAEADGCSPPLDTQLSHTECSATPPWSCDDPASTADEAIVVTKAGSAGGGVLCCLGD